MLDQLNRFTHGYVAIPVILSCRRHRFFDLIREEGALSFETVAVSLKANRGHLAVAWRLLRSIGWLVEDGNGCFRLTDAASDVDKFPEEVLELVEFPMAEYLRGENTDRLAPFIKQSRRRWGIEDRLSIDFLDGILVIPLLVELARSNLVRVDSKTPFSRLQAPIAEQVGGFFADRGWATEDDTHALTEPGRFMVDRAMNAAVTMSYATMIAQVDQLMFDDSTSVFERLGDGDEGHVDRTLNVVGSGFQHEKYFADLEQVLLDIFNRKPFADQPRYVADMGCGDGTLLKRVYELVRDRSERGAVLDEYPLEMVGLDFNRASLAATTKTLGDIPHSVVQADIGNPEQMLADLQDHGIDDPGSILHIRSFLDHDRPYTPPSDSGAIESRKGLSYEGVYVDGDGDLISSEAAVQSLVEHLSRWSRLGSRHGLIIIEVHCLPPQTVLAHFNECENLHFDANQAFSGQQLVEADVFLLSAAEAGMFPNVEFGRKYPKVLPFCRITLNRFENRPYRARAPELSDLPALEEIENACWREGMRTPTDILKERIEKDRGSHCVFEMEGRVVGVVYMQRVANIDDLAVTPYAEVHRSRSETGTVVQLLALNVLPEAQGLGLADQFLDFVLYWLRLKGDVQSIAGVSRCRDFKNSGLPMEKYIHSRDAGGQLMDPILRLHGQHGAQVVGLVPGYRPDDTDNDGAGVLIQYSVGAGLNSATSAGVRSMAVRAEKPAEIEGIVEELISSLLKHKPTDGISSDLPLKALGLDSLDLLELRTLLGRQFDRVVEPTFFFHYSTPRAIAEFFVNELEGRGQKAASREVPPIGIEETGSRAERGRVGDVGPSREQRIGQTAPSRPEPYDEERQPAEAVAIIGASCRFPGHSNSLEQFWSLLESGTDAITEVPADRWNLGPLPDPESGEPWQQAIRYGGFLDQVDGFDARFFNISPREAQTMDPQQRLLLELHWEALEHAGVDANRLKGSDTGVFAGVFSHDYEYRQLLGAEAADLDIYFATGNSASVLSGRVAYAMGLQGPAITFNTACSSSLVAVHQACQSLRSGESSLALASGVNLMLSPELSATFARANMLAPDGRCKTFDASADGYVRSEGAAVVVLKPLAKAMADGDPIMAVIRGSAINQDGASNGLTAPNGFAQKALFESALKAARLKGTDVSYVEAHGTGTSLGDPVEVGSIGAVFGRDREAGNPLILGSVKTNIGHTEAAAGLAGLLKVVLSMQHRRIPPHLHYREANPLLSLEQIPAVVSSQAMDWRSDADRRRVAGVSSFGFSGTNAHVIVEEAPEDVVPARIEYNSNILTLSAVSAEALRSRASDMAAHLDREGPDSLADVCFTANVGRAHLQHRLAVVGEDRVRLREQLRSYAGQPGSDCPEIANGSRAKAPRIAFLFTGQGSQYAGMGRELFETEYTFRHALERCDELLRGELERPLLSVLYPEPGEQSPLDETAYTQPALFAVEYALCQLWRSWGIVPDIVLGHSVGEYAAACAADVFALEDGLALIAARGRLMQALPRDGSMVAVLGNEDVVADAIAPFSSTVSIAAHNGPDNCVISGLGTAVAEVVASLEKSGLQTAALPVSHAFHSPLMEPILEDFERIVSATALSGPRIDLVSNLSGSVAGEEVATVSYWRDHIRSPVQFAEGMSAVDRLQPDVLIEIGPRPILLGMGRECCAPGTREWLPSLQPPRIESESMLDSLARVYVLGADVDWEQVHRDRPGRKVVLPAYPWERESFWLAELAPRRSTMAVSEHADSAEGSTRQLLWDILWKPALAELIPLDLPSTDQLNEAARAARITGRDDACRLVSEVNPGLDELCSAYVLEAFRQLGWSLVPDEPVSAASLADRLGVLDRHRRLLARMLELLAEDGLLRQTGPDWIVEKHAPKTEAEVTWRRLVEQHPDLEVELNLLKRCGSRLGDVLIGQCDALELIFPQGALESATDLYENALFSRDCNAMIQAVLAAISEGQPKGRGMRMLELGAGTGGTTAHILPVLSPDKTQYLFTDISRRFTESAAMRFAEFPFVRYALLDISQDPSEQGFETGGVDVVLAANVLHATTDLRQTLKNVRNLLAAGGVLLLVEGTAKTRWIDLVFGLTEGWWAFRDSDLRADYPLLSSTEWVQLLEASGFETASVIPNTDVDRGSLFAQSVIVARAARSEKSTATTDAAKKWLLVPDQNGVSERLAADFVKAGHACVVAPFVSRPVPNGNGSAQSVDPFVDIRHLFNEAIEQGTPFSDVVYLGALDVEVPDQAPLSYLMDSVEQTCRGALVLAQTLVLSDQVQAPRLTFVTRGTLAGNGLPGSPLCLAQTPLSGMGRVIRREHPELGYRQVDLDPGEDATLAEFLVDELSSSAEDQVAWRGGVRYVPRLQEYAAGHAARATSEPCSPEDAKAIASDSLRCDGTYLITGGFGGLGLKLAEWLVARGASNLVLMGRRGATAKARPLLDDLIKCGARVQEVTGDVSRMEDVTRALEEIKDPLPPLVGIFHCAGVVDDAVLMQQNWGRMQKVMAAKVAGAWNLHIATSGLGLSNFVLFSSWASMIGSPGQSNHAAANAFLDGLAHDRRNNGLAGQSINWGPWSEVGAATSHLERLAARGIESLTPAQGLSVLEQLIKEDAAQVLAVGLDPVAWRSSLTKDARSMLLADLRGESQGADTADVVQTSSGIRDKLVLAASQQERLHLLETHVRSEVARVLLISPDRVAVDVSFRNMGMDSLMAVEFRNRLDSSLKLSLSATMAYNHPSIADLVPFLDQQMSGASKHSSNTEIAGTETPTEPSDADLASLLGEIEGLSDEQAQQALVGDSPVEDDR